MNNNWLKVFTEFSMNLQKNEYIVVGEKDGKAFKYIFEVEDFTYKSIPTILNNINIAIEEYLSL